MQLIWLIEVVCQTDSFACQWPYFLIEKSGFENKLIAQLETEIATSITEKDCATPQGMLTKPGLTTDVAWDNYDETLSGAGALHDTVGICYQNCVVGDSTVGENTSATNKLYKTTKN